MLDGRRNTWEADTVAELCEDDSPRCAAYVKNDHLGFAIPYVHKGRTHDYVPDFLRPARRRDGDDVDRTLIVEVPAARRAAGPTAVEGGHRARLVVRRGQQPRRVRPLGLPRGRPTMTRALGRPARRDRGPVRRPPIIGDPDLSTTT